VDDDPDQPSTGDRLGVRSQVEHASMIDRARLGARQDTDAVFVQ
jgi:hypothetical protein